MMEESVCTGEETVCISWLHAACLSSSETSRIPSGTCTRADGGPPHRMEIFWSMTFVSRTEPPMQHVSLRDV